MKMRLIIVGVFLFSSLCSAIVLNRVAAVVNGEVITEVDLMRFVRKTMNDADPSKLDEEAQNEILKEALNDLIENKLILSFAKKVNLNVDKAEVEKKITVIKKGFTTEMEFLNALEEDGLSYEGLYQRIKDDILKKRIITIFVNKKIEIHPDQLREYYTLHASDFSRPERIKVRKIYIKKEEGVEEKVRQIRELLDKNVAFEDLARNHSDSKDTSFNNGEWVEKGSLKKNIEFVIFVLGAGQISQVIETDNGYYIFQILDKAPAGIKDFEEVKDIIYNKIYQEKFGIELKKFIEDLKKDAQIEVKI